MNIDASLTPQSIRNQGVPHLRLLNDDPVPIILLIISVVNSLWSRSCVYLSSVDCLFEKISNLIVFIGTAKSK